MKKSSGLRIFTCLACEGYSCLKRRLVSYQALAAPTPAHPHPNPAPWQSGSMLTPRKSTCRAEQSSLIRHPGAWPLTVLSQAQPSSPGRRCHKAVAQLPGSSHGTGTAQGARRGHWRWQVPMRDLLWGCSISPTLARPAAAQEQGNVGSLHALVGNIEVRPIFNYEPFNSVF